MALISRGSPEASIKFSWYPTMLRRMFLLSCMCAAPAVSLAVPSISSVVTPILESNTLIVKGAGFLSMTGELALLDEVDSHTLVRFPDALINTSSSDLWMNHGSPWAAGLTVAAADRSEITYYGKGKVFNGYVSALDELNNDSLYVAWDYKPSESPSRSGGSNKFIRVWDSHDGEETRISWTQMHMTYSGNKVPSWEGWSGKIGQWNRMELWVDGNAGTISAYINGKQVHSVNDFTKISSAKGLNVALIGFDANQPENYSNMETYIDNLYVSTSLNRAVLSQESSWENAKADGKIQLISDWSPTQLTVQLTKTGLDTLKTPAYLYIINSAGEVNQEGFEVCRVCPRPPSLTMH